MQESRVSNTVIHVLCVNKVWTWLNRTWCWLRISVYFLILLALLAYIALSCISCKGKGCYYLKTSVCFLSLSRSSAVSLQMIEVINPVGCHYILPGLRLLVVYGCVFNAIWQNDVRLKYMKELNQHVASLGKDFEPLVGCLLVWQFHTVILILFTNSHFLWK